jgi:putative radical SAM enzyme (TIGR03279 family)
MKLSPLHISVHTTNPELRVKMMKNPNAAKIMTLLKRFADANLTMDCQIVLCRDLNDGAELERTMDDLFSLYPAVESVAIVPSGLTDHREGLCHIEPFTPEDCVAVLDRVAEIQNECIEKYGRAVFYCSDEFYLKSGRAFPDGAFYEDYAQIENGVGLIPSMRDEFDFRMEDLTDDERAVTRTVSVATGHAAYPFLSGLCDRLMREIPGLKIHIYDIDNRFFGKNITVAGLVTGGDLMEQLKGKPLGETLCIPSVMLRHERDLFLDNTSVEDTEAALGVPLTVVDTAYGADAFVDAVLGI